MNVSILGVIPWQEMTGAGAANGKLYVVSTMMQRVYGQGAAMVITVLVMWTAFASVFSLTLGYSRVPYAAALDGNYFRAFARVHPVHRIPYVSVLALAAVAALFCFLRLADLIAALVGDPHPSAISGAGGGRDCAAHSASRDEAGRFGCGSIPCLP